jgi:hypothetical protein
LRQALPVFYFKDVLPWLVMQDLTPQRITGSSSMSQFKRLANV